MFSIIVAYDELGGIGNKNNIPWKIKEDLVNFKKITTQSLKKNVVIMGRKTYFSIPELKRPLSDRINIILSRTLSTNVSLYNKDLHVFNSIDTVLTYIANKKKDIGHCFVIGGQSIYTQFLERNLISKVYTTQLHHTYDCDVYFATQFLKNFNHRNILNRTLEDVNNKISFGVSFHEYTYNNVEENKYLTLMKHILDNGIKRPDRTNTGTLSVFGESLKYDLRDGTIPLLTTKRTPFNIIVEELLWMISGSTDTDILKKKNIHIWDSNTSREFLDNRGLEHYPEGDAGEVYGFNLRHFGCEYVDCKTDYKDKGTDQLKYIIDLLKHNPTSRRILFNYWNPATLNKCALPSCHIVYQFFVDTEKNELSACMYQRSSDYFLANNYNAVALCLWVRMLSHVLGFNPGTVTHMLGDVHIYLNHIYQCREQISRTSHVFPKLKFNKTVSKMEDFTLEDFKLINYYPHKTIKAKMAV